MQKTFSRPSGKRNWAQKTNRRMSGWGLQEIWKRIREQLSMLLDNQDVIFDISPALTGWLHPLAGLLVYLTADSASPCAPRKALRQMLCAAHWHRTVLNMRMYEAWTPHSRGGEKLKRQLSSRMKWWVSLFMWFKSASVENQYVWQCVLKHFR